MRRSLLVLGWLVAGLVAIDVSINVLLPYPDDPKAADPGQLKQYFDYGRSSEAKLRRITRADRSQTAPITLAGWYEPLTAVTFSPQPRSATVSFYGMSHSVRLASALDRTSSRYSARSVGAPGATTNWAHGAFLRDKDKGKSRVAVLSVMAANLPMINTMGAMTWNSSFPLPYTSDRFLVQGGQLRVVKPPYESFDGFVRALGDDRRWQAASKAFERFDPWYDPYLMRASVLDHSALIRLLRRGYGLRRERAARAGVFDGNGYNPGSEQILLANAIVKDFAASAKREGLVPIIFVINNYGYSNNLYRALEATLDQHRILYLSSHTIVSPGDPRGYLPDSHFTDANDDLLAQALERVIDAELAKPRDRSEKLSGRVS